MLIIFTERFNHRLWDKRVDGFHIGAHFYFKTCHPPETEKKQESALEPML